MHHRGPFVRGTTIPAVEIASQQLHITSVCAQIRDQYDRVLYTYPTDFTPTSVLLGAIPASVSSKFPSGTHRWDVKVTLQDGTTDVLLHQSTITIEAEVSRC